MRSTTIKRLVQIRAYVDSMRESVSFVWTATQMDIDENGGDYLVLEAVKAQAIEYAGLGKLQALHKLLYFTENQHDSCMD